MTPRLIVAIISSILEETVIVIIVLWVLPLVDIHIPLPGLIAVMAAWIVTSVTIYRLGSRALRRKNIVGLPHMIGTKGKVVSSLNPEGMVRIRGELWTARSADGELESGREIIVIGQDSLKLVVQERSAIDDLRKVE